MIQPGVLLGFEDIGGIARTLYGVWAAFSPEENVLNFIYLSGTL